MPQQTPCVTDDHLSQLLGGALPPARADVVADHIAMCSSCAERAAELLKNDPLFATLRDSDTRIRPEPDHDLHRAAARVADALRSAPPLSAGGPTPSHAGATDDLSELRLEPAQESGELGRLGRYRLLGVLGRGGMGVVFRAEDLDLQREVALKVMTPAAAGSGAGRERFLREARAAAKLTHDHIVPVYHVGEAGGTLYIAMPLLAGETLQARLARESGQRLPAAEVGRIGREVAEALAAAHAAGTLHRDIKPGNVWLDADTGRARILDFGLARAASGADGLTATGAVQGTPAYMSPEQVDGRELDPRSDMFSLGATLYECATGRRAFTGTTLTAVLKAVGEHQPLPPHEVNPAVPPALSALIMRLLAKTASDRPPSARSVADALGVPAAGSGDRTGTWAGSGAHSDRRSRRTFWVVGGVVTLLAVSVGAWLMTRPPERSPHHPVPKAAVPVPNEPPTPARSRGKLDVLVEREVEPGVRKLLRLDQPGALPLRRTDKFRVEGEVAPAAYLYVVWVDPDHDVTPVYPWDPERGWGSRPADERPAGKVSLPPGAGDRYRAPESKAGVATMVLLARSTPLDVSDAVVRGWFETLPELPLPAGGETAAVWFDDYVEAKDPDRPRTFERVGADDPFARWQGQLQKSVGDRASFQSAVSFARTGRK